jgi:hypothetical protein
MREYRLLIAAFLIVGSAARRDHHLCDLEGGRECTDLTGVTWTFDWDVGQVLTSPFSSPKTPFVPKDKVLYVSNGDKIKFTWNGVHNVVVFSGKSGAATAKENFDSCDFTGKDTWKPGKIADDPRDPGAEHLIHLGSAKSNFDCSSGCQDHYFACSLGEHCANGRKLNVRIDDQFAKTQALSEDTSTEADSVHALTLTVTLPYTKADFTTAKQTSFKVAVASAAGTVAGNVDILSITESRRRASSVGVETKIRAPDATGLTTLKSTLGSDTSALKTKLNTELKAQGLAESTGVTPVATVGESLSTGEATSSASRLMCQEQYSFVTMALYLPLLCTALVTMIMWHYTASS